MIKRLVSAIFILPFLVAAGDGPKSCQSLLEGNLESRIQVVADLVIQANAERSTDAIVAVALDEQVAQMMAELKALNPKEDIDRLVREKVERLLAGPKASDDAVESAKVQSRQQERNEMVLPNRVVTLSPTDRKSPITGVYLLMSGTRALVLVDGKISFYSIPEGKLLDEKPLFPWSDVSWPDRLLAEVSPSGDKIFFLGVTGTLVEIRNDRLFSSLVKTKPPYQLQDPRAVAWSQDSQSVFIMDEMRNLYLADTQKYEISLIQPVLGGGGSTTWSLRGMWPTADSKQLFITTYGDGTSVLDLLTGQLRDLGDGDGKGRLSRGSRLIGSGTVHQKFSASRDGSKLFIVGANHGDLWQFDEYKFLKGFSIGEGDSPSITLGNGAISADGKRVALVTHDGVIAAFDAESGAELGRTNATSENPTAFRNVDNSYLEFSADGRAILFRNKGIVYILDGKASRLVQAAKIGEKRTDEKYFRGLDIAGAEGVFAVVSESRDQVEVWNLFDSPSPTVTRDPQHERPSELVRQPQSEGVAYRLPQEVKVQLSNGQDLLAASKLDRAILAAYRYLQSNRSTLVLRRAERELNVPDETIELATELFGIDGISLGSFRRLQNELEFRPEDLLRVNSIKAARTLSNLGRHTDSAEFRSVASEIANRLSAEMKTSKDLSFEARVLAWLSLPEALAIPSLEDEVLDRYFDRKHGQFLSRLEALAEQSSDLSEQSLQQISGAILKTAKEFLLERDQVGNSDEPTRLIKAAERLVVPDLLCEVIFEVVKELTERQRVYSPQRATMVRAILLASHNLVRYRPEFLRKLTEELIRPKQNQVQIENRRPKMANGAAAMDIYDALSPVLTESRHLSNDDQTWVSKFDAGEFVKFLNSPEVAWQSFGVERLQRHIARQHGDGFLQLLRGYVTSEAVRSRVAAPITESILKNAREFVSVTGERGRLELLEILMKAPKSRDGEVSRMLIKMRDLFDGDLKARLEFDEALSLRLELEIGMIVFDRMGVGLSDIVTGRALFAEYQKYASKRRQYFFLERVSQEAPEIVRHNSLFKELTDAFQEFRSRYPGRVPGDMRGVSCADLLVGNS